MQLLQLELYYIEGLSLMLKLYRFDFRLTSVYVVASSEATARATAIAWANDHLESTEIREMRVVSDKVLLPKDE